VSYDHGRKGSAYWRARKAVLAGATHCHVCGEALDFDAPPRSSRAPSVDHIVPLKELRRLHPADYDRRATDPSNMRPCHVGCNARRGAGTRRAVPSAPGTSAVGHPGRTIDIYFDSPSAWYTPYGSPVSRNWTGDCVPGDLWVQMHPEKFSPAVVARVMSQ
jgi:hypothetical protein